MLRFAKIAAATVLICNGSVGPAPKTNGLNGAQVTVTVAGKKVKSVAENGVFNIPNKRGNVTLHIAKKGYIPLTRHFDKNDLRGYTNLFTCGSYSLVKKTKDYKRGIIHGTVVSAHDGKGVRGIRVSLYKGTNTVKGKAIKTVKTNRKGRYKFSRLKAGYYTLGVKGKKFISTVNEDSTAVALRANKSERVQVTAVPRI